MRSEQLHDQRYIILLLSSVLLTDDGVVCLTLSLFTRVTLLVPTQTVQQTHHFLLWKNNLRVTCGGAAARHNRHWWNFITFPMGANVKNKNVAALYYNQKGKCTTKRVLPSWPWRRPACVAIVPNLVPRIVGSVSRFANRKLGCIVAIFHPRIHHKVVRVSKVRQTKSHCV